MGTGTTTGNLRECCVKRPRQTSTDDRYGPWRGHDSAPQMGPFTGLADAQNNNNSALDITLNFFFPHTDLPPPHFAPFEEQCPCQTNTRWSFSQLLESQEQRRTHPQRHRGRGKDQRPPKRIGDPQRRGMGVPVARTPEPLARALPSRHVHYEGGEGGGTLAQPAPATQLTSVHTPSLLRLPCFRNF